MMKFIVLAALFVVMATEVASYNYQFMTKPDFGCKSKSENKSKLVARLFFTKVFNCFSVTMP